MALPGRPIPATTRSARMKTALMCFSRCRSACWASSTSRWCGTRTASKRPTDGLKLADDADELLGAAPIVGTRRPGGDVGQSERDCLIQIEQLPARALICPSADLPAA